MQHHQNPATAAFALRLTMSTRVWHRHLNSWLGTICRDLATFTHALGVRQLSYRDGRDAQPLGDSGFNIATFCLRNPPCTASRFRYRAFGWLHDAAGWSGCPSSSVWP